MILKNKNAIIYGAGGAIGGAVAQAFAREGANVFLTGRSETSLKKVAANIEADGGKAETAVVDASNENAINKHFNEVFEKAGTIDISFNATGIKQKGIQGIPIVDLPADGFLKPILFYANSQFLTAKTAARHMVGNNKGVIITLTAVPSKIAAPLTGGMAPAWAIIESFTRTLAREVGTHGVRVVCLRSDGIPETDTITEVFGLHAKAMGLPSHREFQAFMESLTLLKRLPTLKEVADTTAFIASDKASGLTGTVVNLSCGSVAD